MLALSRSQKLPQPGEDTQVPLCAFSLKSAVWSVYPHSVLSTATVAHSLFGLYIRQMQMLTNASALCQQDLVLVEQKERVFLRERFYYF